MTASRRRPASARAGGAARDALEVSGTEAPADAADLLTIVCPRCGATARERWYGPCGQCRDSMRAALGGEARDIEAGSYEPKMNVTPNAVALKDD